jgi:hypothetical protein
MRSTELSALDTSEWRRPNSRASANAMSSFTCLLALSHHPVETEAMPQVVLAGRSLCRVRTAMI